MPVSPTVGNAKMTPEDRSDIREMVWEMSRTTNKILIIGIILCLKKIFSYVGVRFLSKVKPPKRPSTHYGERFSISIFIDPVKRSRKGSERSIIGMLCLIERFERYFLEREREEHKESTSLSIYPFFTFLLTTDIAFIPFISPFLILSLSFRGQCHNGINTYGIVR